MNNEQRYRKNKGETVLCAMTKTPMVAKQLIESVKLDWDGKFKEIHRRLNDDVQRSMDQKDFKSSMETAYRNYMQRMSRKETDWGAV